MSNVTERNTNASLSVVIGTDADADTNADTIYSRHRRENKKKKVRERYCESSTWFLNDLVHGFVFTHQFEFILDFRNLDYMHLCFYQIKTNYDTIAIYSIFYLYLYCLLLQFNISINTTFYQYKYS